MQSGQIVGIGGGPSCETWSAARLSSPGPPPVRSFDFPWGLRGLKPRQWRQVITKLIQFRVELLCIAAHLGLCGFLGHPQLAMWAMHLRPLSIWTLSVIRMMSRLECMQICSFHQFFYGLAARKPTTLMLLRLNAFMDITMTRGDRGRCAHRAGHRPLQGIRDDGIFSLPKQRFIQGT